MEPGPGGARVTLETGLQLRGVWRIVRLPLALLYRRQLARDLARLKTLVEG